MLFELIEETEDILGGFEELSSLFNDFILICQHKFYFLGVGLEV